MTAWRHCYVCNSTVYTGYDFMRHDCPGFYRPLPSLYRRRSGLRFRLQHLRAMLLWSKDETLKGSVQTQITETTWELVDLDDEIRTREYTMQPLPEEEA
jgi:hypothetical protein